MNKNAFNVLMDVGDIADAYGSGEFPDAHCMSMIPIEPTVLKDVTFTQNGNYSPSDYDCDGFKNVTVNVYIPTYTSGVLSVSENGTYEASDYEWDGFSRVVVSTPKPFCFGNNIILKNTYKVIET